MNFVITFVFTAGKDFEESAGGRGGGSNVCGTQNIYSFVREHTPKKRFFLFKTFQKVRKNGTFDLFIKKRLRRTVFSQKGSLLYFWRAQKINLIQVKNGRHHFEKVFEIIPPLEKIIDTPVIYCLMRLMILMILVQS